MTSVRLRDVAVRGRLSVGALELGAGLTIVLGHNGAGKSTLLDVIAGVIVPEVGVVELIADDGVATALASLAPRARARRIASVGQSPLAAPISVRHRVAQGLMPRLGHVAPAHEAVARAVAIVDLVALADRDLSTLSGGEARRAHVARALVDEESAIVVLDEPFAGVDGAASALIVAALRARAARHTVVVSVHEPDVALALGGRALFLDSGAIVDDGPVDDVLGRRPDLRVVRDGDFVGVLRRMAARP